MVIKSVCRCPSHSLTRIPGDFKQLPPATSKPAFICNESVYANFDFRVLRENRRITVDETRAAESEEFHKVLSDVAWGETTERVRAFIIECYVRGAQVGCAERAEYEGNTAVFTKRRYRDRWNRILVRRIAKTRNHTLKIKARVRSRGARTGWWTEHRTLHARRNSRTQSLWTLHIAGDFHPDHETARHVPRPHMMRTMMVSNLAVEQRFANGTQGRLLYWHPEKTQRGKALYGTHPELLARFAKESAMHKREMFPDIDTMDVTCRQETLSRVQGQPCMLQLPIVPGYALTVHKTQALSIKHLVLGCLEGVFALGQVLT